MSKLANWATGICLAIPLVACGTEAPSRDGGGQVVNLPPGSTQTPGQQPGNNFGPGGTAGMGAPGMVVTTPGPDGTGEQVPGAATGDMPCDVAGVVASNCGRCHGDQPVGGAIKLTTHEDWHQVSPFYDPTKKVYEVAQVRINNGEMPQGGTMSAGDLQVLDQWLLAGANMAGPSDACTQEVIPPGDGDGEVDPPVGPGGTIDNCTKPGAFDPLVAEGAETCYEFPVHAPGGTGPFTVPTNESYHEWYYAVPWGPNDVWTRYGADFDNLEVLHHYLAFTSSAARAPGDVVTNVLGTTLGTSATLIGGWAVGGCRTENPVGVGGDIPNSPLLMIQWHMYNNTGRPAQDASKVQFCVVPDSAVDHVSGITFLGTENFNGPGGMPPGDNDFTTQCTNNSGSPITVIGFNPHMHLLGTHMKTDVRRADGSMENIFDMPFQFDYQVSYDIPPATIMPGETLVTTCSFFNSTGSNVAFGESTNQEMCYQFAMSYPAGALNNGALSLIGALNTCW